LNKLDLDTSKSKIDCFMSRKSKFDSFMFVSVNNDSTRWFLVLFC